jgi:hypothetical protein
LFMALPPPVSTGGVINVTVLSVANTLGRLYSNSNTERCDPEPEVGCDQVLSACLAQSTFASVT